MFTFLNLQEKNLKLQIWCILMGIVYKIQYGGIGIIMVIWLLGGEPFYTPLPACLCPVLSSGPAPNSHSAQSWYVLLKISLCAHLSSLSPWGQEIVIHCSLCSILASICKLNQMNLSGEIVIFGWLLFSIHTLLIRLMSRGIESTCKWNESSINQKSSSPPSDNPSERCFCGRTSHFIFIQQWLHQ